MALFEYVHHRIYRFFHSKGDNISEFTATLLLSLLQFLTIIDLMFIVELIYDFPIPSKFAFLPLLWSYWLYPIGIVMKEILTRKRMKTSGKMKSLKKESGMAG